jgi:oxygen-independent coproporphyrinogen-3 oxidase
MSDIELYIHIPFCARKCSYCDFVSFPAGREMQARYADALVKELSLKSGAAKGRRVRSVFIGGGTPSLTDAALIKCIMDCVKTRYDIAADAEVSIEANPCTVTSGKLDVYLEAGINRISIGCQSTNNENLKVLGRLHDFEAFLDSYETARSCGFENINVDMIFALPAQTADEWKEELETVSSLDIRHISAYSLILEEGTPLYKMSKKYKFPNDDETARMYDITDAVLSKHGFFRYEISNHSKPGFECVHNLGYWTGVPYLGFGIAAASYYKGMRWVNTDGVSEYLSGIESASDMFSNKNESISEYFSPIVKCVSDGPEILTETEKESEYIMLGLRLTEGISCRAFRESFGRDIFEAFGPALNRHLSGGSLVRDGDILKIPKNYLFVSNSILVDFI